MQLDLVLVFALDWQSGIDPILLALRVIADLRVSLRRQFTGSAIRGVSIDVVAVDNYVRILVG